MAHETADQSRRDGAGFVTASRAVLETASEVDKSGVQSASKVVLCGVGDVFVDRPKPDSAFALVRPLLIEADLLFGNCEGVYSSRREQAPSADGPLIARSENALALGKAGFHVMSCANNHIVDGGHAAMFDTLRLLEDQEILTVGAGRNLDEARHPAIIERDGNLFAFLAYSSVFPPGYNARWNVPGLVPMRAHTHYYVPDWDFYNVQPGCDPQILTFPFAEDLRALESDILAARDRADLVIVSCHWGDSGRKAFIHDYEKSVAHAAIDSGADLVLGHHHHMLRAVEIYKRRPIFYGLGNFAMDIVGIEENFGEEVFRKLKERSEYSIYPREGYPTLPMHPDSRLTAISRFEIQGGKITSAGIVPCVINPDGQPVPYDLNSERGAQVLDYVRTVTSEAGFSTEYEVIPGQQLGGFPVLSASL